METAPFTCAVMAGFPRRVLAESVQGTELWSGPCRIGWRRVGFPSERGRFWTDKIGVWLRSIWHKFLELVVEQGGDLVDR